MFYLYSPFVPWLPVREKFSSYIIQFARMITERFLLSLRCSFSIHTYFRCLGIPLLWKRTSIQEALLAFLRLSWMYNEECSTRSYAFLPSSFQGKYFNWNPAFLLCLPGTAGRAFCAYFKWRRTFNRPRVECWCICYAQKSKTPIERNKRPQRVVALQKQLQRGIACCGCF